MRVGDEARLVYRPKVSAPSLAGWDGCAVMVVREEPTLPAVSARRADRVSVTRWRVCLGDGSEVVVSETELVRTRPRVA